MLNRFKRALSSIGIQQRLVLLAVLPVLFTTVILGYYVTTSRIGDVTTSLEERGRSVARHLSHALEFALFSGNKTMMSSIAQSAFEDNEITFITVYDRANTVLIHLENSKAITAISDNESKPSKLFFKKPIIETPIVIDDFAETADPNISAANSANIMGWVEVSLTTFRAQERQWDILVNSLLIIVSGFIASAIFAMRFGGLVATPIVHLTRAVKKLSGGDYSVRVESVTGGELRSLAECFNAMAKTIERSQTTMQHQVDQATTELRESVRALEDKNMELEKARREALTASQAKTEFLAKMSHEIRTPVNAILGFAKLIEKNAIKPDTVEYTQIINQASKQLLTIIDDILNYAKLESGEVMLENISFDIQNTLEDAVMMLRPLAHDKKLELVLNIHFDVPRFVKGDPTRINQILTNFINNAIKFTEEGAVAVQVSVDADLDEHTILRIAVTDTGIGINDEQKSRLFRSFSQVDSSITRRFGGTGLGLAIAKRLSELMGGEIGVESNKGHGSTFWVKLKLEKCFDHVDVDDVTDELSGQSVLLIESHPLTRRSIRNAFVHWGMNVIQVTDIEQISRFLRERQFDIVVLGLNYHEYHSQLKANLFRQINELHKKGIVVLAGVKEPMADGDLVSRQNIYFFPKPIKQRRLHDLLLKLHAQKDTYAHDTPSPPVKSEYVGTRILLAEDNEFNRMIVRKFLEPTGIVLDEAHNGVQVIERFAKQNYDLVLMDIHMPEMDGIEAMRQIRRMERGDSRVPIVALTADVFIKENSGENTHEFDDYLVKPIVEELLVDTIRKWIPSTKGRPTTVVVDKESVKKNSPVSLEIKNKLINEIKKNLKDMEDALTTKMSSHLYELIHQFNGMVGYFGIDELLQAGRSIERRFQQGATAHEVEGDILQLFGEIKRYLDSAPAQRHVG